jgi:prolyl oligopeptidase
MRSLVRLAIAATSLGATSLGVTSLGLAAAGPPPTPAIDVVETMFGMNFTDRYRWMEAGGPAFDDWLTAQGAYARATLDALPDRQALLEQLHRLNNGETRVAGTQFASGRFIYSKTRPEDAVPKIFVRAPDGVERILIDPAGFDARGEAATIDYWSVSPDGGKVAFGVSLGGAEIGILRVRDVATGADLPEQIDRTRFARPNWIDNARFLYSRLPEAVVVGTGGVNDDSAGPDYSGGQVFLHVLGTEATADVPVFGRHSIEQADAAADLLFRGLADPGSSVVVGEIDFGLISSPRGVFVRAKDNLGATPVWRRAVPLEAEVRGVLLHDDMLYLRSALDAPRQRILRIAALAPDLARAETVLPEQSGAITAMAAASDALYVQVDEDGIGKMLRIAWDGTTETLALPFAGAIIDMSAVPGTPGVLVRMQSWTRSPVVYAFDPATGRFTDTGIAPPSPVSYADIGVTEVRAPASDGAAIPLSIVAPRGTVVDGRHPVLLYVYGAYGVPIDPSFSPLRRAWFDRGGVVVVAHVRGSGGFGEDWHEAGRLASKSNSTSDFITAAEYLVRSGWARQGGMAAMGGSAGGIVVGGALAARPELFGAVVIEVGLLNALRLERIPIGPFNTGEFGSADTEDGVRMLYAIDAYLALRDGVNYPGVVISTGRNDTRISPWMPAKFAARLQAANAGSNPILLRVDDKGGHYATTKRQAEEELADYYAFMLAQLTGAR